MVNCLASAAAPGGSSQVSRKQNPCVAPNEAFSIR